MFNKNDPLLDSVAQVMKQNQAIRDAEKVVNEAYGITDKRQLPFNLHSEYDTLVQEALEGNQHIIARQAGDPSEIEAADFDALRAKKKKPMMKKPMDEQEVVNTAAKSDSSTAPKVAPQSTVTLKPLNKPGLPKLGGMTVAKKNMEEQSLDEISKKTLRSYIAKSKTSAMNLSKKANSGKVSDKEADKLSAKRDKRDEGRSKANQRLKGFYKPKSVKYHATEEVSFDSVMEEIRNNLNENAYYVINNLEEADQIAYFESLTEEQLGLLDEGVMDYIGTKLGQAGSAVYNKAKEIGGKVAGAAQAAGSAIDKQLTSPIGRLSPIGAMYSGAKGLAGAIGSGISAVKKDYQSYETGKKFAAAPDREGVRPGPGGKTDSSAVRMGGAPGAAADAARPAAPKVASQAAVASGTSSVPAPKPKPKPAAGITPPATGSIVKNRFGGLTRQNFGPSTTPGGGRNPLGGR